MEVKNLVDKFVEIYGESKEKNRVFMSPGRVNLIGEYTDFNGGQVFPCALDFGTLAVARKRLDNKIKLASMNFEKTLELDTEGIVFKEEDDWCNYPKGVMKYMIEEGFEIGGLEILYEGSIPNGAGLSSSASIEVLTGVIIDGIYGKGNIDRVKLAKICQEAENMFVGVNCGIMDQFAISVGKKNKTLLLNCETLDYRFADFNLKNYSLVIMNTNKRRSLNESKYNERRDECESALHDMNEGSGDALQYLCQITPEKYEVLEGFIKNRTAAKRAEHIIKENSRVSEAAVYLEKGDLIRFGELLCQSHKSLKELLEVTGFELDTIVAEAVDFPGCIGARMTGAGFGGCAISLVETSAIESFKEAVGVGYTKLTGYIPDFYLTSAGDGARELCETENGWN